MGAAGSMLEGKTDEERAEYVARFQMLQVIKGLSEDDALTVAQEGYLYVDDKDTIIHDIVRPVTPPTEWADYKDRGLSLGVALYWMRCYVEKGATTQMAAIKYMKRDTEPYKCPGYALFTNVKVGPHKKPATGVPNAFISHPWGAQIEDTLLAAEDYCMRNQIQPEDLYIWMDIFCLNQHVEIPGLGIDETTLAKCFIDCIKQSKKVLCFCDTLTTIPRTFQRCWCLWEVYSSLVMGAKFDVIIVPAAKKNLDVALSTNYAQVTDVLQSIRSEEAQAYSPEDAAMIKSWICKGRADLHMPAAGHKLLDQMIRNAVQSYLRSSNGTFPVNIKFINNHSASVDIVWSSYQGEDIKYNTLEYGESYEQPSFATHPWKIVEAETGTVLKIFVAHVGQTSYDVEAVDLSSRHSQNPCTIYFVNNLPPGHYVEVRWVNFEGEEIPYCTLSSGQSYVQQSYLTHPWKLYDISDEENHKCLKTFMGRIYDNLTDYSVFACNDDK